MSTTLSVFQRQEDDWFEFGQLLQGKTLGGFEERRAYRFRVDSPDSHLYIDDAPLDMDPQRQYWHWTPGFYAGEVVAELERSGQREPLRFLLDVEPAAHKSGREQYREYLATIADYAPQLLNGSEPARHGMGGRSEIGLSLWLRYARLRNFVEAYLSALRAICECPLIRQQHYREQIPVHLARRVDLHTVRRLESNPRLMAAIAGQQVLHGGLDITDNRLDVPFNQPTMDHPANRVMAMQLDSVRRLVDHLQDQFIHFQGAGSETETDLKAGMPRRIAYLSRLHKQLARIARRPPFSEVTHRHAGVAGINAVTGSPHYDRGHRLGVRILREGLSQLLDDEQHYLAPTWQIYESWCFVALARQLEGLLPDYQWHLKADIRSAEMILQGGKGDERIRLYTQMMCPSMENQNRYGYCSISRERRPDLVLEYLNGGQARYIALDSKYTTSRPGLLEAMASAHIYKDSLRLHGGEPDFSLLLAPGNPHANNISSAGYLGKHRVGCVVMQTMADAEGEVKRLIGWLKAR